jgi:hypothetical protein
MRIDPATWLVLLSFSGPAAAAGTGPGEPDDGPSSAPLQTSDDGGFSPRRGFYFGLQGTWAQLGGDFDGDALLMGATDTIEIPDADSGLGFGLARRASGTDPGVRSAARRARSSRATRRPAACC